MSTLPDPQKIAQLKSLAGAAATGLADDDIWLLYVENGSNMNKTAAVLWTKYAASSANLIDVSEGSSSRKLSSIHAQALKMAQHFESLELPPIVPLDEGQTRTVRITRS